MCYVSNDFEADLTECYKLKGEMTIPKHDKYANTTSNPDPADSDEMEDESNQHTVTHTADDDDSDEDIEYLRKFYVMPDFHTILKGYVKEEGEVFSEKEQVRTPLRN